MYHLYHIKGIKWGCTKRLHQRLREQSYSINDVCEVIEVDDINKASNMERELNIRDGYGWNASQDYRKVDKFRSVGFPLEASKLGGKIGGGKNRDKFIEIAKKHAVNNSLKSRHKLQKPVLQFDLQGNLIKEWPGVNFAKRETGIEISHCVRGLKKTAGGYVWKFKS